MLARIRKAQQEREGGFTLIELLIVIVVLGVLAGIVVFGVGTFRGDSQLAACKADLKTVSVASTAYNAKTGNFESVDSLFTDKYLQSKPPATEGIAVDTGTGAVSSTVANCTL